MSPSSLGAQGTPPPRQGPRAVTATTGRSCSSATTIAVAETQYGRVRGYVLRGIHHFLGIPYGADTSGANRFMPPQKPKPWTRRVPRAVVGQHRAADHGQPVREHLRLVPRPLELRRRQRGLPEAQRLHAGARRREEAAGALLAARRRVRERQRHRAGRLQRRELRAPRRRGLRLDQPPPRAARLLRPRRRGRRGVRRVRERRDARLRRGARVGARQHRALRRRSGQRHDHGAVGRRREGLCALTAMPSAKGLFHKAVVLSGASADAWARRSTPRSSVPRSWPRRG